MNVRYARKPEDKEYRFPIGMHGFRVPDIHVWNKAVEKAKDEIMARGEFRGSVEDLVNSDCPQCHGEFVRVSIPYNHVFRVGAIACAENKGTIKHAVDYWVEVWPDANWSDDIKPPYLSSQTPEEIANKFKLSDPKIKKCYLLATLDGHNFMQAALAGENMLKRREQWPKPDFVHK